jgi:hypothetical protein
MGVVYSAHDLAQDRVLAQKRRRCARTSSFVSSDIPAGVVTLRFATAKPGLLALQLTAAIGAELLAAHGVTGLTLSG